MEKNKYTLSRDVVLRRMDDRTSVYHRQRGGLCMLDKAAVDVLESFKNGRVIPNSWIELEAPTREAELIQQLAARGFLINEEALNLSQSKPVEKKVNIIQLILANACNFGCTYCFEGIQGKEMSVEEEVAKIELIRVVAQDEIKVDINNSMYASKERFEHQFDKKIGI